MEESYSIKEFNKGILTLMKNDIPVVCSFNAQPYISGTNAIGQPQFSNTACGSWCIHFELRGESKKDGKLNYDQVNVKCGCEKIVKTIDKTEIKDEFSGKILNITNE